MANPRGGLSFGGKRVQEMADRLRHIRQGKFNPFHADRPKDDEPQADR